MREWEDGADNEDLRWVTVVSDRLLHILQDQVSGQGITIEPEAQQFISGLIFASVAAALDVRDENPRWLEQAQDATFVFAEEAVRLAHANYQPFIDIGIAKAVYIRLRLWPFWVPKPER